jgi:hypothetical protein
VSFSFLSQLSESSLFPSKASLERYKAKQIGELTFLYLCAMRIAFLELETTRWAREYARKTVTWGNFDQWRNNATDLYVLLHAIKPEQHEEGSSWYPLNHKLVMGWLKEYAMGHPHDEQTRRLFVRLDFDLRISDVAMRSLRRMIMEWPTLESPDKKLALTRLHMMLRSRAPKSELLGHIHFLMERELELREDASSGASCSSNVATVAGGLGAGFDADGDWGIYSKPKKKTDDKPLVLRRAPVSEGKALRWSTGYYVTDRHTREVIDGPYEDKIPALRARQRWPMNGEVHYTDGVNWYAYEGSPQVLKPFRSAE